jgi:hypothetical protein
VGGFAGFNYTAIKVLNRPSDCWESGLFVLKVSPLLYILIPSQPRWTLCESPPSVGAFDSACSTLLSVQARLFSSGSLSILPLVCIGDTDEIGALRPSESCGEIRKGKTRLRGRKGGASYPPNLESCDQALDEGATEMPKEHLSYL